MILFFQYNATVYLLQLSADSELQKGLDPFGPPTCGWKLLPGKLFAMTLKNGDDLVLEIFTCYSALTSLMNGIVCC